MQTNHGIQPKAKKLWLNETKQSEAKGKEKKHSPSGKENEENSEKQTLEHGDGISRSLTWFLGVWLGGCLISLLFLGWKPIWNGFVWMSKEQTIICSEEGR